MRDCIVSVTQSVNRSVTEKHEDRPSRSKLAVLEHVFLSVLIEHVFLSVLINYYYSRL